MLERIGGRERGREIKVSYSERKYEQKFYLVAFKILL